ncbi:hypothetical protein [Priestia aryabhattai]
MELIQEEIVKMDEVTFKTKVYYKKGPIKGATQQFDQRGYYFSVEPLNSSEEKEGNESIAFEKLLLAVDRKSKKAEREALKQAKEEPVEAYAHYIMNPQIIMD